MQDTVEIADAEEDDHLSTDEVRSMLQQLDRACFTKIDEISRWFAFRCRMPAEDLRQEAFKRLLGGSRRVPRGADLVRIVAGVIQSIASAEIDAIRRGFREVRPAPDGTCGHDAPDPSPSPEQLVLSAHDDGEVLAVIDRILEDDEELQLLVEGICDDMRGEKLEELLGVDSKGLAAVRKRLKRRLQAAFPKGREQ